MDDEISFKAPSRKIETSRSSFLPQFSIKNIVSSELFHSSNNEGTTSFIGGNDQNDLQKDWNENDKENIPTKYSSYNIIQEEIPLSPSYKLKTSNTVNHNDDNTVSTDPQKNYDSTDKTQRETQETRFVKSLLMEENKENNTTTTTESEELEVSKEEVNVDVSIQVKNNESNQNNENIANNDGNNDVNDEEQMENYNENEDIDLNISQCSQTFEENNIVELLGECIIDPYNAGLISSSVQEQLEEKLQKEKMEEKIEEIVETVITSISIPDTNTSIFANQVEKLSENIDIIIEREINEVKDIEELDIDQEVVEIDIRDEKEIELENEEESVIVDTVVVEGDVEVSCEE